MPYPPSASNAAPVQKRLDAFRICLLLGLSTVLLPHPKPSWASDGASMQSCAGCHPATYASFLRHGMAGSLGAVDEAPEGMVSNRTTGMRYEVSPESSGETSLLTATGPDGGARVQRIVGRIGAGIFDRSWASVELDIVTGETTNRLFFAPIETITGHGLELSPFEHSERPSGLDMPLTDGCLTCHTDTPVASLPSAARSRKDGDTRVQPANALGIDAFSHLRSLDCAACHGPSADHLDLMSGRTKGTGLGLPALASLPAAQQIDVCARCHLQGDARFEMVSGRPELDRPLLGQIPMLVPAEPDAGFRFVGQVERLVLSDCFQQAEAMTCTTCHDPHRGVAEQGLVSFENACRSCHGGESAQQPSCNRPAELTVPAVTGTKARGEAGCVDCHVRRSQPYDLPGIRSTDHYIRKNPPAPRDDVPFRAVAVPGGELELFDDPRARKALATAAGRQWREGLLAMGYAHTGRFAEALGHFASFPTPGTPGALRPTAPAGFEPIETWPTFHELRALTLLANRRPDQARAAFEDALKLDPLSPGALIGRARLAFGSGHPQQALLDTQTLIETYPESEAPWQLRTRIAQRMGHAGLIREALEAQARLWPSNAQVWLGLAGIYQQQGDGPAARQAIERVQLLQPSLLQQRPSAPSQ